MKYASNSWNIITHHYFFPLEDLSIPSLFMWLHPDHQPSRQDSDLSCLPAQGHQTCLPNTFTLEPDGAKALFWKQQKSDSVTELEGSYGFPYCTKDNTLVNLVNITALKVIFRGHMWLQI